MSKQNEKLSEELEVYFNNYAKSWLDNDSEVIEAVRELEFQLDAHISAASVEAREADRLRAELDQATVDYGKLKGEALAAYKTVATERDEWKEIADTWAKQHHELGTALDAAEAKLAAVREWADTYVNYNCSMTVYPGDALGLFDILDTAPVTTKASIKPVNDQLNKQPKPPRVGTSLRSAIRKVKDEP